jgi:hypothetical protein
MALLVIITALNASSYVKKNLRNEDYEFYDFAFYTGCMRAKEESTF